MEKVITEIDKRNMISNFFKEELKVDLTHEQIEKLKALISIKTVSNSMKSIIEAISIFGLKDKTRKRNIADMRILLFHRLKEHELTLEKIGLLFNRDHATVIHGLKQYEILKNDSAFIANTDELVTFLDTF